MSDDLKMKLEPCLAEKLIGPVESIEDSLAHIQSLLSSLNSLPVGIAITEGVFIAVIGALSAYFFNYFHWNMVSKKNKVSELSTELSSLISELESVAVNYWLTPYCEESKEKSLAAEIAIKSKRHLASRYIRLVASELKAKKYASINRDLDDFDRDIFDLVTGDHFESHSRNISPVRASKIAKKCGKIKSVIIML